MKVGEPPLQTEVPQWSVSGKRGGRNLNKGRFSVDVNVVVVVVVGEFTVFICVLMVINMKLN